MSFDTLLGNDRLKQNLAESLAKNHISHFYLISGPAGSGKRTLAKLLSAAILCRGSRKPCGTCESCRKLKTGNHPDVITVEDPEHKNVAVKIVRAFREDVFIRPNESDYKIYLFPQDLGVEGQNALLKILEEPPSYAVFILLTDNPEKFLPTVRSRCTELKLHALPETALKQALRMKFPQAEEVDLSGAVLRSGGFLGQAIELLENGGAYPPQAEAFAQSFSCRDPLLLAEVLAPMEKWKRNQLLEMLQIWLDLTQQAMSCRAGVQAVSPLARTLSQNRTAADLYGAAVCLQKAMQYADGNVSPAAICGWLLWQLR